MKNGELAGDLRSLFAAAAIYVAIKDLLSETEEHSFTIKSSESFRAQTSHPSSLAPPQEQ